MSRRKPGAKEKAAVSTTDDHAIGRQNLYDDEIKVLEIYSNVRRARKTADTQYRLEEDHVKNVVKTQGTSFNPRAREVKKRLHDVTLADMQGHVRSVSALTKNLSDDLSILKDLEKQCATLQETMESDLFRIMAKKEDELAVNLK